MLIFKKICKHSGNEIEYKMDSDATWTEAIDNFLEFLRGCGYVIPYGNYELINLEEKELGSGAEASYCSDCSCGKKEAARDEERGP